METKVLLANWKLLISILLLFRFQAFSQKTPMFQFPLYVMDAVGNLDSVIIGYDTSATFEMDPEFGEIELNTPFDSIFEVRAGTGYTGNNVENLLSKKHITFAEKIPGHPRNCSIAFDAFVYIWAKNQPVKIFWDKEIFNNNYCVKNSLMTIHYADAITDPFDWFEYPDIPFYCMANDESFFEYVDSTILEGTNFSPLKIEKEVNGQGLKDIYAVRFRHEPFPGYPPCQFLVDTKEPKIETKDDLYIYPNPSSSIVHFRNDILISAYSIIDMNGKILKHEIAPKGQVDISSLKPGLHIFKLLLQNGKMIIRKVVKL